MDQTRQVIDGHPIPVKCGKSIDAIELLTNVTVVVVDDAIKFVSLSINGTEEKHNDITTNVDVQTCFLLKVLSILNLSRHVILLFDHIRETLEEY